MIVAAVIWLIQDLAQVLAMGVMLVPELFLLAVIYGMLAGSFTKKSVAIWIWASFVGGLLWDLRWASVPGMSSLINVICVVLVCWRWSSTPTSGHSPFQFSFLCAAAHFISGMAHYFAWAVPSSAAVSMFIVQQLVTVPIYAAMGFVYAIRTTVKPNV